MVYFSNQWQLKMSLVDSLNFTDNLKDLRNCFPITPFLFSQIAEKSKWGRMRRNNPIFNLYWYTVSKITKVRQTQRTFSWKTFFLGRNPIEMNCYITNYCGSVIRHCWVFVCFKVYQYLMDTVLLFCCCRFLGLILCFVDICIKRHKWQRIDFLLVFYDLLWW